MNAKDRLHAVSLGLAVLLATTASAQSLDPAPVLAGKVVWTRKPTGEAISAMRPARVVRERVAGGAVLDCRVTSAGGLADCKVGAEAPQGYGFGAAALRLAGQYRVAARTATGEPTAGGRVRAPVTFNAARVGGAMTLMAYPMWVEAPSVAEVEAAYPASANGGAGKVVVRCAFDIEGHTTDCAVKSQTPADKGFGLAALALAEHFVVLHTDDDADILPGVIADIPINFRKPGAGAPRLPEPQWRTALTAAAAEDLFPLAARDAKVTSGVGTVECLVNGLGGLTDCRVTGEQPDNLGFGAAALEASKPLVISPWSSEGEPFAGRRLTVPIRLRLVSPVLRSKPVWISRPSERDLFVLRPTKMGAGQMAGGATLNCVVTATGALNGCTIQNEAPKGYDFGAAVLETAPLFRMAPKTDDGEPTTGTRVRVPVTFPAQAAQKRRP